MLRLPRIADLFSAVVRRLRCRDELLVGRAVVAPSRGGATTAPAGVVMTCQPLTFAVEDSSHGLSAITTAVPRRGARVVRQRLIAPRPVAEFGRNIFAV